MKKAIVYSVIFCLLSAQTEMHELLKLPFFVCHYFEHIASEDEHSFQEFLIEHYSQHGHCGSQEHHHDLPFKDCHGFVFSFLCSVPPFIETFSFVNFEMRSSNTHHFDEQHISECFVKIWQPPKLAA